jgi:TonB family protein
MMSEFWSQWENQSVNGVFPLRRFLGGSDHSGVFLTEFKARNLPNAALKLVPAIPTLTETQLSHWTVASALSHPHLLPLLEVGRCRLGDLQFLFVVMEYAEQTLSQLLPQRALTPDEARDMLSPILAALAFLHGKGLVQGRLKPANILVVGDQLKLASDTIRPAGESNASIAQASIYDPPEASDGSFRAAGDTWSLGITVIEALTQHPPAWSNNHFDSISLPATLSAEFAHVLRQCLDPIPTNRPTFADLEAQRKPVPQACVSPPAALAGGVPSEATYPRASPKRHLLGATLTLVLVVLLSVWAGLHSSRKSQNAETSRSTFAEAAASASASAPTADSQSAALRDNSRASLQPVRQPANDSPSVLHEEIPDVPRSARNTIHGRINVAVRVTVDGSGRVTNAALKNPGPSKYFARLATEAARKWKFVPADNQESRKWLVRFEFTRGGAIGHAPTPGS